MNIKNLITASIIALLSACTTVPTQVVLSPQPINYSSAVYSNKNVQLNITDKQMIGHVVQIKKDNQPTKLLSSAQSLQSIINQTLIPVLRDQGITIKQASPITVDIFITDALINIEQKLIQYSAENSITLKVVITNNNKSLTKVFSDIQKSKGFLNADIAVLERNFNNQLAAVLVKIVDNSDIQKIIKSTP